jgi:hypothetical protein
MFSLFRTKTRCPPSRDRATKKPIARPKFEPGQYDRPSLEGYAVQELEMGQYERSAQTTTAGPAPEQLRAVGERAE